LTIGGFFVKKSGRSGLAKGEAMQAVRSQVPDLHLDVIGLDEFDFRVTPVSIFHILRSNRMTVASPWIPEAVLSDPLREGRRWAQLLGSYVGQHLDDVTNTIREMSLGLKDMGMPGTRSSTIVELGAFGVRHPRECRRSLIFCTKKYKREVYSSAFDASSATERYSFPYLGYSGGRSCIAMWDPDLPIPAYGRVLVIEK